MAAGTSRLKIYPGVPNNSLQMLHLENDCKPFVDNRLTNHKFIVIYALSSKLTQNCKVLKF